MSPRKPRKARFWHVYVNHFALLDEHTMTETNRELKNLYHFELYRTAGDADTARTETDRALLMLRQKWGQRPVKFRSWNQCADKRFLNTAWPVTRYWDTEHEEGGETL